MTDILENKFSEVFSGIIRRENIVADEFAVAVSGGADSLALLYLMIDWGQKNKKKIVVLTVNHNLRDDSLDEAKYVASLMKKIKIEHHILTWDCEDITSGIEEQARIARYSLLSDFCQKRNIKNLLLGHHKLDQVETFLMRLQRGSGLDGLSAMSDASMMKEIRLLRPLLSFHPEELKTYLSQKKIEWKEDYLNEDERFFRVRIRKSLELLEGLGISTDRIYNTTIVLNNTKNFIDSETTKFIEKNVIFFSSSAVVLPANLLRKTHREIVFRTLSSLFKKIGMSEYPPLAESVLRLCDYIYQNKKQNGTLGGCEFLFHKDKFWLIPELKNKDDISKERMEEYLLDNQSYKPFPYKVRKYLFYNS